jgi:membrane-bound serine protease (ClpP class)
MNTWAPFIIVYLFSGFSLIPLAKKSPKYFGPAKEIMEFLVVFTATGGGVGVVAALFFAFLWPLVLVFGLFLPPLTLENTLGKREATDDKIESDFIGTIACCLSDLRPSGLIEVDGKTVDATCLKDFLPRGSSVKIVKKQGFNYVVEKIV